MEKKIIYSDKAPAAVSPYSHAIRWGNMLFTSGQIPLDPGSGRVVEGARSCVALDRLPRDVLVEIEGIAVV